ncbi:nucleophile aminohydrolase [Daedaleopsis nitida]|nr:nucleophile aminohydrolase [Daedaleopsis nitida]
MSAEHANESSRPYIVAVHGGAGFHAPSSDTEVKRALRSACKCALAKCMSGDSALQAVNDAISVLEDNDCLNAGFGSNLTATGAVECDASIMSGHTGDFGAVGAISGVKHPIQAAHEVLKYSQSPDPLGRIPPLSLVSGGAVDFARLHGVECVAPESLVSPRAQREWTGWTDKLQATSDPSDVVSSGSRRIQSPPQALASLTPAEGFHDRQDTVGALAWDASGDLAAGVSRQVISIGGLLLKLPGRVGEAAIHGAGCWATATVACSVSGAGEYITRMSLARTICEAVEATNETEDIHDVLQRVLGSEFFKLCAQRGELSPQAGVLLLVKECDDGGHEQPHYTRKSHPKPRTSSMQFAPNFPCAPRKSPRLVFRTRLWCAFTTESMAIGVASSLSQKPSAAVLRRPPRAPGNGEGPAVYIAAVPLHR